MVYFKILPFKVLSTWVNSLLLPLDFCSLFETLERPRFIYPYCIGSASFPESITPQEKFGRRPVLNIRAHPR